MTALLNADVSRACQPAPLALACVHPRTVTVDPIREIELAWESAYRYPKDGFSHVVSCYTPRICDVYLRISVLSAQCL